MGDRSEVVPDPEVLKLYDKLRALQAETYAVTEELGRRLAGGERWATILKRLETAFDAAWCTRYAPGHTKRYQFHFVKDRPQWKRLYNRLGEPDLVERIGVFVRNNEQFFVSTRHSFAAFVTSINQHVPAARHRIAEPRMWDCPHLPKCGSESMCGNLTTINEGRRQRGAPLLVEERSDAQNPDDQGGRGTGAADSRPADDGRAQGARRRR